ncbi:MAG: SIMPL domain-containing protein [Pseudomonadota bacterium]|nr:SIMPL domain-containing protein [Pseudomonadota bacterium]
MRLLPLVLLLAACPPPHDSGRDAPVREVSVSATSRINVAPDEATISLTFSSTAATMRTSHAASGKAVEAFRAAVLALGIPAEALELGGTTDDPNYRWNDANRVVSYTSTTLLNVRTKDFERVAEVVDTAVASGVTAVDVSYHSTTMPEHKKRAREMAIVAAKEKAGQLAAGTGAKLGEVRTVSEGTTSSGGGYRSYGNMVQTEVTEPSDADGAIAPGTTPLELTIQATFALE